MCTAGVGDRSHYRTASDNGRYVKSFEEEASHNSLVGRWQAGVGLLGNYHICLIDWFIGNGIGVTGLPYVSLLVVTNVETKTQSCFDRLI